MNEVKDSCDKRYFAHTLKSKLPTDWQSLEVHLKNAAELVRSFADECGEEWGDLAEL